MPVSIRAKTLDVLVRPRLNPVLTPYLESLTGITNEEVHARGVDFVQAYREFVAFAAGLPIVAFGRDDLVFLDNSDSTASRTRRRYRPMSM